MADRKVRRPEPDESDEAPVRKKKKKKKEAKKGVPMVAIIAGISVVVLILLAFPIWAIVAYSGGGVKPVTEWDKYSSEENEFGFDYPKDWRTKSYGIKGKREVEVRSGGALISVKENITGSLIGDIAGAFGGRGAMPEDDERSPVAAAHALRAPKDLPNYKEGKAETVTTRFGKARRSPYTDGSKKGYRVTVLMGQTALDVFCESRGADWEMLRPAFDRVIESLGPGR